MGTYTISKTFHFSAAHHLEGLSPLPGTHAPHPCSRQHGHNYTVELILRKSVLDAHGFVLDYHLFKPFQEYIDTTLDHHDLNEVLGLQTTAENLARHLYDIAWKLFHDAAITVRVSETAKTWAQYSES
jgi:6-pyruvoyltetrahydropterin/6-carboxytetrahydropterin synthase